MTIGERFAQQAVQWLGVPYQHRGATQGGCDCTGLLIGVAQEMGYLENYELRKYPIDWNLHGMADNYIAEELGQFAVPVANSEIAAGDVLIMHFGRCLAHCGILVNREKMLMVHCWRPSRKVVYGIAGQSWKWRQTYRLDESKLKQPQRF
jgi:cell wall-associated NlpC family hydrolase